MNRIDLLRKAVTIANEERKAQATAFVEFLGELQIPSEQIIQIVDKVTDLLEVSIDDVVFEALINESEQIMQVFDEEEDGQPLS